MDDRFNTIAGWVLFAGIIALGFSVLSGKYFHADSAVSPENPGYIIKGDDTGTDVEVSIEEMLNKMTAEQGEKVFAKCTACHTINAGGADGIGPNLHGVMGKPVAGGSSGFAYSSALSGVGGNWDWDTMSAWIKSPRAFANGNKMSFAGIGNIEDRAALLLYLNEQGSNLPVPEFVAAVAEEAAAEGEEVAAEEAAAEGEEAAEAEATEDAAAEENEGGA